MTSVHDARDPRIFSKQCKSLASGDYRVTLVAATSDSKDVDGVEILAVGPDTSRWKRMSRTAYMVYRAARRLDADVYHFHDPELIPWGLLLARSGKPVVYDIHEDYYTSLKQKVYLPEVLRVVAASGFRTIEQFAARWFTCVIAESYYAERFPNAVEVLNYPVVDPSIISAPGCDPSSTRLLYTGGVSIDRGAVNHVRLLVGRPDCEVHFLGRCDRGLARELRRIAGDAVGQVRIEGEGYYLDPERVCAAYREGGWLAGLALFPKTEHYRRKILTKFFEYMMAGLPVLCSNFPVWKKLVEETGCGIAVDPEVPGDVLKAIEYLQRNPDAAHSMGERGRRAVLSQFNWSHEYQKLDALYDHLLQ